MKTFKQLFKHISVIAFDLDDTLYDRSAFEQGAYQTLSRHLAKKYQIKEEILLKEFLSIREEKHSNYPHLFSTALARVGIDDPNSLEMCLQAYRSYQPITLMLYPGVLQVLSRLGKEYVLALITNGREKTQRHKVQALGLESSFQSIVYADALGEKRQFRKPHSKPYEVLLQEFQIDPSQMLYVGDNPFVDFLGALSLGVHCVRVLTGEYRQVPLDSSVQEKVYTTESIEAFFHE